MAIIALTTLLCINTLAQRANMVWGDEFKLRKGSTDLQIIFADKSGVYMKEAHFLKEKYIHSTYTTSESATLIKLDKGLTELYRNKFDKELKGKEYEDFFFLKNKLFLLASDYDKKSSKYIVYAAEVDKNSGELVDKLTAIASWDKHEKEESVFKAVHNHDSSKMVLVCAIEGREKSSYQICQLNEQLQTTEPPISISNEYDAKTFQLEDVVYAQNGHIVLVSREYEYEEGRKEKKDKFLHFKNYSVRICDGQGRLVKNINTSIEGKWVMSVKVMQMQNKELVLAAFYGDEKRGSEVNGIFIQRVDATSGDIISSSQKELNTGMVEDLADEKKNDNGKDGQATTTSENKQDGGEGFSRFLRFRSFISTSDNGVVILAEKHRTYISKYVSTNPSNGNSVVFNFLMYECGDIFMCKMNATGNIDWLHIMPKLQREPLYFKSLPKPASVGVGTSFFKTRFNLPFYASFGLLQTNNTLSLIFNDEPRNSSVLQTIQKPYAARNLNVSDCFAIHLNMLTGQYTRSVLFSNIDVPTAMPRFSRLLGNQLYMIGKQERVMAKTKFIIGRLTIK